MPASPAPAARRPGRPPDLEKRQAILDAAREVLAEVGYASMTIDAVAQRAGSNRVLIYRVWDTKLALARDALLGGDSDFVVPDTGELARRPARLHGPAGRPHDPAGVPDGRARASPSSSCRTPACSGTPTSAT